MSMLAEVTAMQLYCFRLARLIQEGWLTDTIAALAKRNNARKAQVIADARDIPAGNGILLDYHVMRHMYYSRGFPICDLTAAQRDVRSSGFRLHCVTSFRPARARLPRRAAGSCSDASGRRPGGGAAGRTSAGRRRAGRG